MTTILVVFATGDNVASESGLIDESLRPRPESLLNFFFLNESFSSVNKRYYILLTIREKGWLGEMAVSDRRQYRMIKGLSSVDSGNLTNITLKPES